jgi:predicted nucleic acid-binding protein
VLLPPWFPFTSRRIPDKSFTVDSSVLVKWFKKGEEFDEEATRLREEVLNGSITLTVSEWTLLEVARALMKVDFPRKI